MTAHTITADTPHVGFQIAPMIDVVFVIMLFFMVMAGAIKSERHLIIGLPSGWSDGQSDELLIGISEDGYVTLNEEEVATGADTRLADLYAMLYRLQLDARARQGPPPIVTIQTDELTRYQRIVDVLNVLGKAELRNVTFTAGTED